MAMCKSLFPINELGGRAFTKTTEIASFKEL